MISSNVFHTIESNGKDLLVDIFDETTDTDISKEMEKTYLNQNPYYILKSDIVEEIKIIWNICKCIKKTGDTYTSII